MHYGAEVRDNVAPKLVAELLQSSDYAKRKQSIHAFNQNNDIIKRGIALTPLMFGISFNAVHYNQAGHWSMCTWMALSLLLMAVQKWDRAIYQSTAGCCT